MQVMDSALMAMFGRSEAFSLTQFKIVETVSTAEYPFDGDGIVISMGYMLSMVVLLPMGFLTLDEVSVPLLSLSLSRCLAYAP